MTALSDITAEYAASKGLGLTQQSLIAMADECRDTSVEEDATVELYFDWRWDDDRRHFYPHSTLIGAVIYGNDSGEIEAVIGREDAITRWSQKAVIGLEEASAERAA